MASLRSVFAVDVGGSDGGLHVPAGGERQNGVVPHALHHKEPTLAAAPGELGVHKPPEGEGAARRAGGSLHTAAPLRGSSLHLAAVQRVGDRGEKLDTHAGFTLVMH